MEEEIVQYVLLSQQYVEHPLFCEILHCPELELKGSEALVLDDIPASD